MYLQQLSLTPLFGVADATVPVTSVGAIGRCAVPCVVRYAKYPPPDD